MTTHMTTNLSRKWWYVGIVAMLSTMLANLVLDAAGMPSRDGLARWTVYFLCFVGFWRSIDFAIWFAMLLIAPSSKLLDRAGR